MTALINATLYNAYIVSDVHMVYIQWKRIVDEHNVRLKFNFI